MFDPRYTLNRKEESNKMDKIKIRSVKKLLNLFLFFNIVTTSPISYRK